MTIQVRVAKTPRPPSIVARLIKFSMRILIAAIGRFRDGPEYDLYQNYIKRSRWPIDLREFETKKKLTVPARKKIEESLLVKIIPKAAVVVVLDETGMNLSSISLAKTIGAWQTEGRSTVTFLIGGPDGITDALRQRADLLLSLGAATWPHLLVRPLLAEQLYRAETILTGHPYHRRG